MEKVTSTARRKFSFPSPVDVNSEHPDEQDQEKNDERQTALQSAKAKRKRGGGSISQMSDPQKSDVRCQMSDVRSQMSDVSESKDRRAPQEIISQEKIGSASSSRANS